MYSRYLLNVTETHLWAGSGRSLREAPRSSMRTNRTSAGAALADAALLVYAVGVSLKCSQRRQSGHYQDQLWRGYMSVLSIGKNASEIARLMFRPYLILTKAKKAVCFNSSYAATIAATLA
jgi:hypothetical protein